MDETEYPRLTDNDIRAIELRAEAATVGPWVVRRDDGDGKKLRVFTTDPFSRIDIAVVQPWMTHDEPNAEFISRAREDVPALIREVADTHMEVFHFSQRVDRVEEELRERDQRIEALEQQIKKMRGTEREGLEAYIFAHKRGERLQDEALGYKTALEFIYTLNMKSKDAPYKAFSAAACALNHPSPAANAS